MVFFKVQPPKGGGGGEGGGKLVSH
jgi:hypothetical protein